MTSPAQAGVLWPSPNSSSLQWPVLLLESLQSADILPKGDANPTDASASPHQHVLSGSLRTPSKLDRYQIQLRRNPSTWHRTCIVERRSEPFPLTQGHKAGYPHPSCKWSGQEMESEELGRHRNKPLCMLPVEQALRWSWKKHGQGGQALPEIAV